MLVTSTPGINPSGPSHDLGERVAALHGISESQRFQEERDVGIRSSGNERRKYSGVNTLSRCIDKWIYKNHIP
jgi:hypothetical protein